MVDEVLKNEELLEKVDWQRKTYPLKLNLTDFQKVKIESMAYEFRKIVNGAIKVILENVYPKFILNGLELPEKGQCPLCKANKKLDYILEDFEIQTYGDDYRRVVYKKGCRTKVCNCFQGNTSPNHRIMRMFMLPTKDRTPLKENDITQFGKSEVKTIYDSALQKAMECIKSQVQIKQKINWKINNLRERIMNNNVLLNNPSSTEFLLFQEKYKCDDTIKLLRNFIKKDENDIERLKGMVANKIEYKYDVIRLYDNTYSLIKNEEDYYIKLKDYVTNEWITLKFYGDKYQKKLAESFINSKNAETEIIRKGNDFYLQYIYRKEEKVPIPDETFTAVGIDIGILNLACRSSITKENKLSNFVFYNGRRMRYKRKRMSDLRKVWNKKTKQTRFGGKGRTKKWFQNKMDSQNEQKYVKYSIHYLTTKIIQDIKDTIEKPVIVLENLKDIRFNEDRRIKIALSSLNNMNKKTKRYIREYRQLTFDFNKWNFDDFQKFIEYKANWLGIPVVYVSAKDTTIKCNKCGYIGKDIYEKKKIGKKTIKELINNENIESLHQLKFKCSHCGYQCNSDFNASVNIGRLFFDNLTNTKDI